MHMNGGPQAFRPAYVILGLIIANIFVGVLTGRGKDRDFFSKNDNVHPYNSGNKGHNDPLL